MKKKRPVKVKGVQWMRRIYSLHREAQWSLQCLHNSMASNFCERKAAYFVRYLEDHSGAVGWCPGNLDWHAERTIFEAADFIWGDFQPLQDLPQMPYVVMELLPGNTVHALLGFSRRLDACMLSASDKSAIVEQATEALEYLTGFGLIHRDFRPLNMLWAGSAAAGQLKVIDLGLMTSSEETYMDSNSSVTKCSWGEADPKIYDWAPPEVKTKSLPVNFALPPHSFDVYSLGVLILQLETSDSELAKKYAEVFPTESYTFNQTFSGIDRDLLRRMLGEAAQRPHPREVLIALQSSRSRLQPKLSTTASLSRSSRSRSRERLRGVPGSKQHDATTREQ